VICSRCSELTVLDPCPHCGRSPWLDARYELLEVLSSGDQGTTYSARERGEYGGPATLEIHRAAGGDARSLERQADEARARCRPDPSGSPEYLDAFVAGEGANRALYRVVGPVGGHDLAAEPEGLRLDGAAAEGSPERALEPPNTEEEEPVPEEVPLGNLGDAVEAARDEERARVIRTRILKGSFVCLALVGLGFAVATAARHWPSTDDIVPGRGGDAEPRAAAVEIPPPPEPEPTPAAEVASPPLEIDEASRVDVGPGTYPVRSGESGAAVTIVVFSDFGCVYCARLATAMAEIDREYGQGVAVHFRDFPLALHRYSEGAHIAARCADAQGRFWAMHDLLFEHFREHEPERLPGYARDLGLDESTFRSCLNSAAPHARLEADRGAGKEAGVISTPTYFINGVRYSGGRDAAWLRRLVDAELSRLEGEPLSPGSP